jgi:hypothetical protein
MRTLALVAAVVVVAASASASASTVPNRTCPTRVETPGPFRYVPGRDPKLGRLVFFGLGDGVHVPAERRGEDRQTKLAVGVRTGRPVTLRLIPDEPKAMALDYIRAEWRRRHRRVAGGSGQEAVRFVPCPPETPKFSESGTVGPWTAYNGGILVAKPGCATIRVTAPGEPAHSRRIAVGVPVARCR